MARRRDKSEERDVASARITTLLDRARSEALNGNEPMPDRYAELALAIAKKYQTGLPREAKAQVCRACGAYRVPGRNSRARLARGRIVTTCLQCGDITRRPLAVPVPKVRPKQQRPLANSRSPRRSR